VDKTGESCDEKLHVLCYSLGSVMVIRFMKLICMVHVPHVGVVMNV